MKVIPCAGALVFLFLASCAKMYINPQFREATFSDIKVVKERDKANISGLWQTNGKHVAALDQRLINSIEQVFQKTRVIEPVKENKNIKIHVVFNNVADINKAFWKGFGAGASFGLAGNTVVDYYEIEIMVKMNGEEITKFYKHAVHTTIGNKPPPAGMIPVTQSNVLEQLVEDVVLNFLKEMQDENRFIDIKRRENNRDKISILKMSKHKRSNQSRSHLIMSKKFLSANVA